MVIGIILALFLVAFVVCCIYMAIKTSKIKKMQKKALKQLKTQGLTQQVVTMHTYGLPVAEGVACTIQAYNDHLDFFSGTTHISLTREKITDMCVKGETEIQQQYVSSIGGAVGGAVLFGPLGAMIGGRAKKKTTKTTTFYLIITYKNNEGSISYLGFDVSACYFPATKLVTEFHKLNQNGSTHIEL